MAESALDYDPWRQLSARSNKTRVPTRTVLTKDTVYGRKRPDPEIIEHMLDDLETKLRNYFVLYNRERELRKQAEENAYRLEQEIVCYQQKLDACFGKMESLESKVRSLIGQPLKIKDTIDKIDLLYTQMDTLIQAILGIGSCAAVQGYSRNSFVKLCLEYLYPCRDLDARLNTLYTALYSIIAQNDAFVVHPSEVMESVLTNKHSESNIKPVPLQGLKTKIHHLILKCDLSASSPSTYSCCFRYDDESRDLIKADKSRFAHVNVKPLDNASKFIEFGSFIEIPKLPPRIPNVIPNLILDFFADDIFIGSAEISIIDEKTLKSNEPWKVHDTKGVCCGDVTVTVYPLPESARLPAATFSSRQNDILKRKLRNVDPNLDVEAPRIEPKEVKPVETDQPKLAEPSKKESLDAIKESKNPAIPKDHGDAKFQPKRNVNFRKPLLFKGKSNLEPPRKSVQTPKTPKENTGDSETPVKTPSTERVALLAKAFLHKEAGKPLNNEPRKIESGKNENTTMSSDDGVKSEAEIKDKAQSETVTLAPKSQEIQPKTATPAPKSQEMQPKTATLAPKIQGIQPKTVTLAPKGQEVQPKTAVLTEEPSEVMKPKENEGEKAHGGSIKEPTGETNPDCKAENVSKAKSPTLKIVPKVPKQLAAIPSTPKVVPVPSPVVAPPAPKSSGNLGNEPLVKIVIGPKLSKKSATPKTA